MTTETRGLHALAGLALALVLAAAPALADNDSGTKAGGETGTVKTEETAVEEKPADAAADAEKTGDEATEEKATDDKAAEKAAPPEAKYVVGDVPVGDENAPVTVIEYASFTCPHCASWHTNVWDQLKENYIDTGKVRFILREVYFDKYGLWASMTARCAGPDGFYPMVDTYLKTQNVWTRAPDIGQAIQQIGRRAGVSNERLAACLSDRDYAKALLDDYKANAEKDDVRSTPTFIINGDKATGSMSYEEFAKLIDEKLN